MSFSPFSILAGDHFNCASKSPPDETEKETGSTLRLPLTINVYYIYGRGGGGDLLCNLTRALPTISMDGEGYGHAANGTKWLR